MKRFIQSMKNAMNGLWMLIKTQKNFRIHICISLLVFISGFFFRLPKTEWLIIIILMGMVMSVEAINTSIELLSDKIEPEIDERIGKLKDIAAAAVLITAVSAATAGIIIFLPYISELISQL